MTEKNLIVTARILSMVFTPFYLPFLGLVVLFSFSYMGHLPLSYIITTLLMVYLCTILLPTYLIHLYRHLQGWDKKQMGHQEHRMVPYIISMFCYFVCFYLMSLLRMPSFMGRIVMAALVVQIVCAIINIWWKISTHTAGIGGVTGAIMAFSLLFQFNPLGWLCAAFAVGGTVAASRMILLQHSLAQVVTGFLVGMVIAFFVII